MHRELFGVALRISKKLVWLTETHETPVSVPTVPWPRSDIVNAPLEAALFSAENVCNWKFGAFFKSWSDTIGHGCQAERAEAYSKRPFNTALVWPVTLLCDFSPCPCLRNLMKTVQLCRPFVTLSFCRMEVRKGAWWCARGAWSAQVACLTKINGKKVWMCFPSG